MKAIPITRPSKDRKPRESVNGSDHQRNSSVPSPERAEASNEATNLEEAKTSDSASPEKSQPSTAELDFRELVERANQNDRDAMAELRNVLDSNPEIWQEVGDLSKHCRMTLARLISQGDQLLFESVLRKVCELEKELLGASPSALERLAVERVINVWMQMQHADAMVTANSANLAQVKFWSQHQDRAFKRYSVALKQLDVVRKLSPATAISEQAKTSAGQTSVAQTSEKCQPRESHDVCPVSEKDRNETPAAPVGGADHHRNGHFHSRTNGHANGKTNDHTKSAEAVVNDAQVKPDLRLDENDEANHSDASNGKSVNRILRFAGVAYAPDEIATSADK